MIWIRLLLSILSFFASAAEMDREAIRKVIREHMAEVRGCYDEALKKNPKLEGKSIMEWSIGEGGKVLYVKPIENLDGTFDICLVHKIRTWKFPEPPKGDTAVVHYPFLFSNK